MKKITKLLLLLLIISILIPTNISAKENKYKDIVGKYYDIKDTKTINIYLFYSKTCPHCKKEQKYLKKLQEKYKEKIKIYTYEVTTSEKNNNTMKSIKEELNITNNGVPFTVIGKYYILGYTESYNDRFINLIEKNLEDKNLNESYNIPLLGKIDAKKSSISLIAIILGFIDGFNPCAMWILLLLINMSISVKDKKKMILICLTFILSSGLVYLLSMLGIGLILDLTTVVYIRNIIALFALILGTYNIYTYYKTRKETGCHVVKKEKRKTILTQINKILKSKNVILMLLATAILALSVNLIELACSLGFPTIFLEILSINKIHTLTKILYLLLYTFFYLIDDLIVLIISIITFETKGISTKYNKYVNLLGGIIMIIMGILLIFKPEWIMFNF